MKLKNIFYTLLIAGTTSLTGCVDNNPVPVLGDPAGFVAPELINATTGGPTALLPADATTEFEKFEWSAADFGVDLPVQYTIEMSMDDFTTIETLTSKSASLSASITVEDYNDAANALGATISTDIVTKIRVKAVVNGGEVTPLYSTPITRTINVYQLSDCGNWCAMGMIGDGIFNWSTDVDMRLNDPAGIDKYTWTLTAYLSVGPVKFRANDGWNDNWGGTTFPSGTGVPGGADLNVDVAGWYKITFNDKTLDYLFELLTPTTYTSIGLAGENLSTAWDPSNTAYLLTQDNTDPHLWTGSLTLPVGQFKFTADLGWNTSWGGDTYPSGYGTSSNGANINIPTAGTYMVYFHDVTGEYAIMNKPNPFPDMFLIGSATPNGWSDPALTLIKNPLNPYRWSAIVTLTDGAAKFKADVNWVDNWGGSTFPRGIGSQGGPDIPIKAGKYMVSFHSGTGEYRFLN